MSQTPTRSDTESGILDRLDWGKLGWGLGLLTLGLVFALDRFTHVAGFERIWPLVLAVLGLVRLLSAKSRKHVETGLWLLATSSWLLINFLGLAGFYWSNSWPLWIVMAGIIQLIVPDQNESRWGGLVPLAIGVWLLLVVREVAGLTWSNSWPMILIVVGLSIVFKALTGKRSLPEKKEESHEA
jgi:hypothetical protein